MLFFELLQVALGNRDKLSAVPSANEWSDIYEAAGRQAVTGILLHGIGGLPAEQKPMRTFLLQWIGVGQFIEQRNHVLNKHCVELLQLLEDKGLQGSILKGQGIAQLYDKEIQQLRQSGDIDVYVDCGLEQAIAFAKAQGQEKIEWDYKHLHLKIWKDTEVEVHYHVEVLLNLWKNRKLQQWFKEHEAEIFALENDNTNGMVTPTVEFNVFYILLHIYRHFLYEGVGLRQIIDYYFVLSQLNDHKEVLDVRFALDAVSQFGMERFAKGLMWVMQEALGMQSDWMLWEPDQKEGDYILNQVMKGGNFGHHDERLKKRSGKIGAVKAILSHNMHLLTHYPADTIWAPIWIVWHKLWKVSHRC